MSHYHRTLVSAAIALALAASGNAAAQFTNVYFFGDSLTDMGTYKPVLPPGTGLFTTNPGPVWAQPFAEHLGFSAIPANQGGTDYAQGGARVTLSPGYAPVPPTGNAVPISAQITQALGTGAADSTAIYSVWGGGNDIFTQLDNYRAGKVTLAQLQTNVAAAGGELAQQVARLGDAGARYIMIWNMPNIGATPFGIASGAAPTLSAVTDLFNSSLTAGLNASGVPTIRLNPYRLYAEVMANPASYGLQNVTASACGDATPSVLCTSANFVTPEAPQTYLWATDVHPSTAGHAILAQYAESMITGPQQIATPPARAARRRGREFPRARRSDVVEPRCAPVAEADRDVGRVRLRQQRHECGRRQRQRQDEHDRGRRRQEAFRKAAHRRELRLHGEQGRFRRRRRRLQAAPAGGHVLHRLRRRAVVRRARRSARARWTTPT